MSKTEKLSLVHFVALLSMLVYLVWFLFFSGHENDGGIETHKIRSRMDFFYTIFMISFCWYLLVGRRELLEDERARLIAGIAANWGFCMLATLLMISTNAFNFSFLNPYADMLRARSMDWYEIYVIACVVLSLCVHVGVAFFLDWRDWKGLER